MNQTAVLSPPGRVSTPLGSVSVYYFEILVPNYDLKDPHGDLYDLCTYSGRVQWMATLTNPRLLFASNRDITRARCIVYKLRKNQPLPPCITADELRKARILYESAFNYRTGNPILLVSRLAAQPWMTGILAGSLLTYYQCLWGVMTNHSLFHAYQGVRNASLDGTDVDGSTLLLSFLGSSAAGILTALWLNRLLRCRKQLWGRFVPAVAMTAGLAVGVPMLRWHDYQNGLPVYDKNNNYYFGHSTAAAIDSITAQTACRIMGVVPGMVLTPFIMERLYRRGFLCRYPWSMLPINIALMSAFCLFTIPLANAMFPQRYVEDINSFEPDIQDTMRSRGEHLGAFYRYL